MDIYDHFLRTPEYASLSDEVNELVQAVSFEGTPVYDFGTKLSIFEECDIPGLSAEARGLATAGIPLIPASLESGGAVATFMWRMANIGGEVGKNLNHIVSAVQNDKGVILAFFFTQIDDDGEWVISPTMTTIFNNGEGKIAVRCASDCPAMPESVQKATKDEAMAVATRLLVACTFLTRPDTRLKTVTPDSKMQSLRTSRRLPRRPTIHRVVEVGKTPLNLQEYLSSIELMEGEEMKKQIDRGRRPIEILQDQRKRLEKAVEEYKEDKAKASISQIAKRNGLEMQGFRRHLINIGIHKVRTMKPDNENEPETNVVTPIIDVMANLTTANKRAIHSAISEFFDAENGIYLKGKSDQEIGRDLKLPWAAVTKIREEFFGSLRIDPEIGALRVELEGLRNRLANVTPGDFDSFLKEFDIKIAELDGWRREVGEWRAMVGKERDEFNATVVRLDADSKLISDRLARLERRFG